MSSGGDARERILSAAWDLFMERGFAEVKADLDHRLTEVRTDMDRGFAEVRADMDHRFAEVRADMDHRFADVKTNMDSQSAELRRHMGVLHEEALGRIAATREYTGPTKAEMNQAFADLTEAWSPVMNLEFEYINSEVNPHFANIVSPSEIVVVSRFKIDLEGGGGHLHVTFPYSMIEPVRDPFRRARGP